MSQIDEAKIDESKLMRFLRGIFFKKGASKDLDGVHSLRLRKKLCYMSLSNVCISKKFGGSVKRFLGRLAIGMVLW